MRTKSTAAVLFLFFLSGAAGLMYQVVWMRKLVLILGTTSQAVSTVLAVFMGGLALGSWLLGRRGDRARSPLALYGWMELGIAALGFLSAFVLDALIDVYAGARRAWDLSGPTLGLLRIGLASAVLLVPTTLMGATLPVLVRGVTAALERVGRQVGVLYAVNTLGAAAGTLLAGFFLVEAAGLRVTTYTAASLNLVAGLGALALARTLATNRAEGPREGGAPPTSLAPVNPGLARLVLFAFGVSGFLALAYEVLWTRYLIYVVGQNSTYAFSTMLATLLAGIVLGSALGAWLADRSRAPVMLLGAVLVLLGAAALGTVGVMGALVRERQVGGGGETWLAATVASFLRCTAVLIIPTTLSGLTFPLVARIYATRRDHLGGDVGRAYAVNTLGAILGALAGGLLVLPLLGLRHGLSALAAVDVLMGMVLILGARDGRRALRTALATGAVAALAFGAVALQGDPQLEILRRDGREVLFYEDGPESSVGVARTGAGDIQLYVDGDAQASTEWKDQIHLRLLGHLPALLHPDPADGLVVGFGGGITSGCLAQHPLERIDVVELSPAVRRWAVHWEERNHDPLGDSRVNLIRDDGRNFLLSTDRQYDVITSDPIDPDDAGVTSLYSREYYELVRAHLREGGVAVQWMTAHYEPDVYRTLVRTFQSVFPHTTLWFAYYTTVLIGLRDGPQATFDDMRLRLADPKVRESLAVIGLERPESVISLLFAGPDEVRALAGVGPLNTDDRPRVEYAGPRWKGRGESTGGIARAFGQLARPSWDACLSAWTAPEGARIDAVHGWVQVLLRRDGVEAAARQVRRSAGESDERWLRTAERRDRLAARYLGLTWEVFIRPVPPMALRIAGMARGEPSPSAPAGRVEAYERGMAAGRAAWSAGDLDGARAHFAATAAAVPGALLPAILVAACDHRAGYPVAALRSLLAVPFAEEDRSSACARLPHEMVGQVLYLMGENEGEAGDLGLFLLGLMPDEVDRPPAVSGARTRLARPEGKSLGDVDAWRLWWREAIDAVEIRRGRFAWIE